MSTVIDELVVALELDGTFARNEADKVKRDMEKAAKDSGKEFEKAGDKAKKAGDKAKEGAKTAESGWTKLASSLKASFLSLASGAMALYGIHSAFSSYLSTADAMGKFADSIGQNIEDIHAWSEAVIRSGGSAEGFQGSLKSLSTQLSKMSTTGKSRAGNILESVGIDAGGIGRARKSLDVMMEIADKMQGMSKEEALGFGASLGIDAGTIMLLQQGRGAVADLVRKQKELGVYTKEDAKITAEFNDAVADSKQAFMGFASIIFRMVTPAVKWLVDNFTQFIAYLKKHEVAVKAFIVMVATLITAMLIPAILELFATLLANPITWIALLIAGLALALEDLYVWANDGDAAFGELWSAIFGTPQDARETFDNVKKDFEDFVTFMQTDGKEIAEPFIELAEWLVTLPLDNLKSIANLIKTLKEGNISDILKAGLETFVKLAFGSFRIFASIIGSIVEVIAQEASKALTYFMGLIKEKADEVVKWIQDKIKGLSDIELPNFDDILIGIQTWGNENFTTDMFGIDAFVEDAKKQLANLIPENPIKTSIGGVKTALAGMVPVDDITSKISAVRDFFFGSNAENEDNAENTIGNINGFVGESGNLITSIFNDVFGFLDNGLNSLQGLASSVTSAIAGFFAGLGESIKSAIGEAIDWALGKLAELAAAVRNTPIIGGVVGTAIDYVTGGGGGSTSNSSVSTKIGQITVNTQATDANGIASDIGGAVNKRFSPAMANGGSW